MMDRRILHSPWLVAGLAIIMLLATPILLWAIWFYCPFCPSNPHSASMSLLPVNEVPDAPVHLIGNETGALGHLVARLEEAGEGQRISFGIDTPPYDGVSTALLGRWEAEYGQPWTGPPLFVAYRGFYYEVRHHIE